MFAHVLVDWDWRNLPGGVDPARVGVFLVLRPHRKRHGGNNESAYCASKFGIEGFSRALAVEFAPYNVSVNTITPGHPVHTSMSEITYDAEKRKIWKEPGELAPAFIHLARQDASGLNDSYVRAWDLVLKLRGEAAA